MFASSGDRTAPCGVPVSGVHSRRPSRTPCSRNISTNRSTRLSDTFSRIRAISRPFEIVSK